MKEIENIKKSQSRWNDLQGKSNLAAIQNNPEAFIVDPEKISKQKLDMIEEISDLNNKKILEYGSGRGEFSVVMAKLGGIVTGVDIGNDLVELAKKTASLNNVECHFMVCSIDKLKFEDESFDFVIGSGILHHLPKKGVIKSLSEAYRVLKPGGKALFIEPVENSKTFDFIQNLIPVDKPGSPRYRPSILNRKKWNVFLEEADDRSLSDAELINAKGEFSEVKLKYYGFLIRLGRLYPNKVFKNILKGIDYVLTHDLSPLKKLSQSVIVIYKK